MAKHDEPIAAMPAPEPAPAPVTTAAVSDDAWASIATLHDPVQARALRGLLENAGIPAATPGAEHRAALGFVGAYVSIAVQVPERHRAEATRLYEAFVRPGLDSRVPSAGPASEASEPSGPSRLKRIAVFMAIWAPIGAGHLYARDGYAALVLFLAQSAAVITLCAGGGPSAATGAVLVWVYDVIGSVYAVERHNRGRPRTPLASVAIPLAVVLVLHALAVPATTALETHVRAPSPSRVPPEAYGHEGGTGSPTGLPITAPFSLPAE